MVEPSKNADNTVTVPECKQDSLDISNGTASTVEQQEIPNVGTSKSILMVELI